MVKILFLFSLLSLNALSKEIPGIIKSDKGGLDDYSGFIVYIKEGPKLTKIKKKKSTHIVTQVNKNFSPAVSAISAGSAVDFKNYDDIFHNVFSLSPEKKFDLGIYKGDKKFNEKFKPIKEEKYSTKVDFPRPGKIKVFCNIHENMMSTIYVFDHGYYSQVSKDGHFKLPIPNSGDVTIVVDGERLKSPIRKRFNVKTIKTPLKIKFSAVDRKPVPKHSTKDGKKYEKEWSLDEDEFY